MMELEEFRQEFINEDVYAEAVNTNRYPEVVFIDHCVDILQNDYSLISGMNHTFYTFREGNDSMACAARSRSSLYEEASALGWGISEEIWLSIISYVIFRVVIAFSFPPSISKEPLYCSMFLSNSSSVSVYASLAFS